MHRRDTAARRTVRRAILRAALCVAAALAAPAPAAAAEPIRIGRVAHLTGPAARGEAATHTPNIELWLAEVNARGGLLVDGRRRPVEIVEYDDASDPTRHIELVQRLAARDEVDFILSPWGTGFNRAAAPIYARFGFPLLTVTNITDEIHELAQRFPNMFFMLGSTTGLVEGLRDTLLALKADGAIEGRVALVNVADAFGIELARVARRLLPAAGLEIVFDKSYRQDEPDLTPVIKGARLSGADAFVAFSYPPDTYALTAHAVKENLQVGAFYAAVASSFPAYAARFGAAAEGTLGAGGVNLELPEMQAYRAAFKARHGAPPEYWASATYYASLQVLEQAIEGAGTLDRAAVVAHIKAHAFDTAIGRVEFDAHNESRRYWTVGQWQGGVFTAVAGVGAPVASKPAAKRGWR